MLPVERRSKLLALLQERKTATTEELARLLDVSEMTVRRDLEQCQREGKLQRCHGGATINMRNVVEAAYEQKLGASIEVKRRLAKRAAQFVSPGMTVYLDAGTTTYCLAEELVDIEELTVITNDLKIAQRLLPTPVEVVVLGGRLQKRTGSMLGGETVRQMKGLRATVAFTGAASIDEHFMTYTPTQEKVFLKQEIHRIARTRYLITDASKFHSFALYCVDSLSDYDGVITDAVFSESEKRLLGKKTRLINP
ncbi:MAG: DeoR/GlpR family DNA-binding transcription regulator [Oscillospiraceae bacterium]